MKSRAAGSYMVPSTGRVSDRIAAFGRDAMHPARDRLVNAARTGAAGDDPDSDHVDLLSGAYACHQRSGP